VSEEPPADAILETLPPSDRLRLRVLRSTLGMFGRQVQDLRVDLAERIELPQLEQVELWYRRVEQLWLQSVDEPEHLDAPALEAESEAKRIAQRTNA
jgi:hypothetical protein